MKSKKWSESEWYCGTEEESVTWTCGEHFIKARVYFSTPTEISWELSHDGTPVETGGGYSIWEPARGAGWTAALKLMGSLR